MESEDRRRIVAYPVHFPAASRSGIVALLVGAHRGLNCFNLGPGELSSFSDTSLRPLSSTMQTCVLSIDRSNPA